MAKNQAKNAMAGVDAHGSGKTSNMTAADEADAKRKLAQVQEQERLKDLEKLNELKKLKKVKVEKNDLKTLMDEFMLSKTDAELALQRSGLETGTADLAVALRTLVGAL